MNVRGRKAPEALVLCRTTLLDQCVSARKPALVLENEMCWFNKVCLPSLYFLAFPRTLEVAGEVVPENPYSEFKFKTCCCRGRDILTFILWPQKRCMLQYTSHNDLLVSNSTPPVGNAHKLLKHLGTQIQAEITLMTSP